MRVLRLIAFSFTTLALSGCTLIVQDTVGDLEQDELLDMELELRGFDPHIGQITDVWLVDSMNRVQARAIFDSLRDPNQVVTLWDVVRTDQTWRIDFYSDLNGSIPSTGVFLPDPPMPSTENPEVIVFPDHQWRIDLEEDGTAEFMHSTNFTDITSDDDPNEATFFLSAFHLVVTDLELLVELGKLTQEEFEASERPTAEIRVFDDSGDENRQIGLYRLSAMGMESIDITLGGILDQGVEYDVELEINDDGEPFCLTVSGNGQTITRDVSIAALSPCPSDED